MRFRDSSEILEYLRENVHKDIKVFRAISETSFDPQLHFKIGNHYLKTRYNVDMEKVKDVFYVFDFSDEMISELKAEIEKIEDWKRPNDSKTTVDS